MVIEKQKNITYALCIILLLFHALGSRHVFGISVSANLLIIIQSTFLHTLRYLTNVSRVHARTTRRGVETTREHV